MSKPIQLPKATRIEVIDNTGRAFVAYYKPGAGAEIHVQDDERTIKVFAGERREQS